jgi:hypothetical protein
LILKNEHARGLYKGVTASWFRESTYSAIRLGLYEPLKVALGATDPTHTPLWVKFTAGSLAGATGSIIANGTDVLKVRM